MNCSKHIVCPAQELSSQVILEVHIGRLQAVLQHPGDVIDHPTGRLQMAYFGNAFHDKHHVQSTAQNNHYGADVPGGLLRVKSNAHPCQVSVNHVHYSQELCW